MRVVDSFQSNILSWTHDQFTLYLLVNFDQTPVLLLFSVHDFREWSRFEFHDMPNYDVHPCVDDQMLYVPTVDGQILGLDKFACDTIVTMSLGTMVVSADLRQDQNAIYSLCDVPLSHSKYTQSVVCINDKQTGKKMSQSQFYWPGQLYYCDDFLIVMAEKFMHTLSLDGELLHTSALNFEHRWDPIVTQDFIVVASPVGTVQIFNKDLTQHKQVLAERSSSPMLLVDNELWWGCHSSVVRSTMDGEITSKSVDFTLVSAFYINGKIIGNDAGGRLISLDPKTDAFESLPFKDILKYMAVVDGKIIGISERAVFHIEV